MTRTPGSVQVGLPSTIAFAATNAGGGGGGDELGCIIIVVPAQFVVSSVTVDSTPAGDAWLAASGPGGLGTTLLTLSALNDPSRLGGGKHGEEITFSVALVGAPQGPTSWTADVYNKIDCTNDLHLTKSFGVTISAGGGPPNQPPVAADDAFSVIAGGQLSVPAPGILANDTDPEGDPLSTDPLTDVTHGTLSLYADGGFDYVPAAGFVGTDSFTYAADDGALP